MEAASLFQKRTQSNYITIVFIAFSQKLSFLCTLVVQSFSWMFFNIFTQFGINRTALQVRSDTIFPLSFVHQTPGVSFVFTPGLCFYQSQELWGLWRLVFQNFTVLFQVPRAQRAADNDSTPAASETSRGLKRKYRKKYTNYPLTPPSDGVAAYLKEYFNLYLHTFV